MQLAPCVIGIILLTTGVVASIIGWFGFGRVRRTLEWRVFDAQ